MRRRTALKMIWKAFSPTSKSWMKWTLKALNLSTHDLTLRLRPIARNRWLDLNPWKAQPAIPSDWYAFPIIE